MIKYAFILTTVLAIVMAIDYIVLRLKTRHATYEVMNSHLANCSLEIAELKKSTELIAKSSQSLRRCGLQQRNLRSETGKRD